MDPRPLGQMGFNFKFIKSAWEVISADIYSILQEFWETSNLPRGVIPHSSLLSLK